MTAGAIADGIVDKAFHIARVQLLGQSIIVIVDEGGDLPIEIGMAGLVTIGVITEAFTLPFRQRATEHTAHGVVRPAGGVELGIGLRELVAGLVIGVLGTLGECIDHGSELA